MARQISDLDWRPEAVVDIGGATVNGSLRPLLPGADYTSVDPVPGAGVDVVADGAEWQPPEPVALVLCTEVLEHCDHPAGIVANAASMLKPGGLLLLTCAGPDRAPHGARGAPLAEGEYYAGVEPEDLRSWLEDAFGDRFHLEYQVERGDLYALGWRAPR